MDLFYYGSQDVPVPLRRARRPARGGRPFRCESCREAVAPEALEKGEAVEVFGLVLCARCRAGPSAEGRVELYFCDRCQVSVPVFGVESGEALEGDGRVLCLSCREARVKPRRRLTIALVVAGILGGFLLARDEPVTAPRKGAVEILREVLAAEAEGDAVRDRLDALSRRLTGLAGTLDSLRESRDGALTLLTEGQAELLSMRGEFARRLEDLLAGLGGLVASLDSLPPAVR